MKHTHYFITTLLMTALCFSACEKGHTGGNEQGGLLPTNYISIKDSSFSPELLTVVSGSSITFVNTTNIPQTIISTDSLIIPAAVIAANTSFFFKNDTIDAVMYHFTDKPAIAGVVTFMP
jgi:plastocyanin